MCETRKGSFYRLFLGMLMLFGVVFLCGRTPVHAAVKDGFNVSSVQSDEGGHFLKVQKGWAYVKSDGKLAKDTLLKVDDKIYLFDAKGYRLSGWQRINNYLYYFGSADEGYLYQRRISKAGLYYYFFQDSGRRRLGWFTYHNKDYYFGTQGKRVSGWKTIDGKEYYFGTASEGYRYTNRFLKYRGRYYYLLGDGTKAVGFKTINGSTYYFWSNGIAATGSHTIAGVYYRFDSTGKLMYSHADLSISADCAILVDASSGKVLFAKNADLMHANASTTKIMTAILALEKSKLTDVVKISSYAASQEPTKLYMTVGDSFYMKDMLYSLMLPSHNDTAVAIAEHVGGTADKFVSMMNAKAKSLGCTSTKFATPNGLDAGYTHYTTARDLAKIARYAWKKDLFRTIVGTSYYSFTSLGGRSYGVSTTNALLNNLAGVVGMKTGYTNKAGYCFVGAVKAKSGKTYISVVLGASSSSERWTDSATLLRYAYNK